MNQDPILRHAMLRCKQLRYHAPKQIKQRKLLRPLINISFTQPQVRSKTLESVDTSMDSISISKLYPAERPVTKQQPRSKSQNRVRNLVTINKWTLDLHGWSVNRQYDDNFF